MDYPAVILDAEDVSRTTVTTLDFFRRWVQYSLLGFVLVGGAAATFWQGSHMYVEKVVFAPETDPEVRQYGWDQEAEQWSGGEKGGTDPGLGWKGRTCTRASWMAQNWTLSSDGPSIGSFAFSERSGHRAGGLNVVEARLEWAHDFLNFALIRAAERDQRGSLHPQTIPTLLARHASVLERMGMPAALIEAKAEFERVYGALPANSAAAGRMALKLGDLSGRIGNNEEALSWWAKALQVSGDSSSRIPSAIPPVVPTAVPTSPYAQRTLVSTLVSLSAFYSTTGQLKRAQQVQESSIELLRTITPPKSLRSAPAPQALHALYILHRSSLLSIHLAEVHYGLRSPVASSLQWLQNAAESSERVALALTGQPLTHPDAPGSKIPHPPSSERPPVPAFSSSRSMVKPAASLLRDARRSAAEAWNLIGVLNESTDGAKALECYERALGWAGVAADSQGNIGKAGEGVLEAEWKTIWENYVRTRDAVRTGAKST